MKEPLLAVNCSLKVVLIFNFLATVYYGADFYLKIMLLGFRLVGIKVN